MNADISTQKVAAGDDAGPWLAEIQRSIKNDEDWVVAGNDVLDRYIDRRRGEKDAYARTNKKTNILWANTDVLKAHLCVELGMPDVRRAFTQAGKKTKIAKVAASVLEKALSVQAQAYDVTHEFEDAIEDKLLPGRGVAWVELDDAEDEDGKLNWFAAKIVYVVWDRFHHGAAQRWTEVPWVAREHLYSKMDLEDNFKEYANDIPLDYEVIEGYSEKKDNENKTDTAYKRAMVYEVWAKDTRQRIFVAEGCDKVLQADDDPYRLQNFFPCAKPLYAVKTSKSLCPSPLYYQYVDQASELDRLTTRANRLIETMKYCGFYGGTGGGNDAAANELPDLSKMDDGQFAPIKNFAAFAGEGGLKDAFMVRDLEPIVAAFNAVQQQRSSLTQTIYEVTGIADIVRGQTNPNETLGAQVLKARFGSSRSSRMQQMVQRFVRDHYRIQSELIAEHYSRDQLQAMTGIVMPTLEEQDQANKAIQEYQQAAQQSQQTGQPVPQIDPDSQEELQAILSAIPWEDIKQVLRSNTRRMMLVDVETDDTEFADEEKDKESALEFSKTLLGILQETLPALKEEPILLPLVKETVLFISSKFKAGDAFEDVIEETFASIAKKQAAQAQQPPQPTAEQAKAQQISAVTQAKVQEHQADMQLSQQDAQQKQEIHAVDMKSRLADLTDKQQRLQLELQEAHAEFALKFGGMMPQAQPQMQQGALQ